jgi:hypothetical protein
LAISFSITALTYLGLQRTNFGTMLAVETLSVDLERVDSTANELVGPLGTRPA